MTKGNMERKLRIMQHLYGEAANPEELEQWLEDARLRKDYAELREVHRLLASGTARAGPQRPPSNAVDRIMEAAASKRGRRNGSARRVRHAAVWGGVSVAAVSLLLLLIWPDADRDTASESAVTETEGLTPAAKPELTWDDTQEFMEVHQRLNVVRQRMSPLLWDESAVMTLDSIPDTPGTLLSGFGVVSTGPQ